MDETLVHHYDPETQKFQNYGNMLVLDPNNFTGEDLPEKSTAPFYLYL
jgi:hypothetical protein